MSTVCIHIREEKVVVRNWEKNCSKCFSDLVFTFYMYIHTIQGWWDWKIHGINNYILSWSHIRIESESGILKISKSSSFYQLRNINKIVWKPFLVNLWNASFPTFFLPLASQNLWGPNPAVHFPYESLLAFT